MGDARKRVSIQGKNRSGLYTAGGIRPASPHSEITGKLTEEWTYFALKDGNLH